MAKNKKHIDTRTKIDIKSNLQSIETGIINGVYVFTGSQTLSEFAQKIKKPASSIIKLLFMRGEMVNVNTILDEEKIAELCLEFGLDFQKKQEVNAINILETLEVIDKEKDLRERPPVVTIMGHVDHGKTTLLDTIRNANVAKGEAGGITQHIGAYQIDHNGKKITFIDTPGHAAFTQMRARGANVTDVVIIVVAADDGMMPQTEEAIDHAKASGSPIIVFINKMDKETANPEKVMSELSEKGLMPEEWGGETIYIKGSALRKEGIEELLENISLLCEINEWKANPNRLAMGTVIESHMDKGLGPVATLLVQNGTLKLKDIVLVGSSVGKVRTMVSAYNKPLKSAYPSSPVRISGLDSIPMAGERFLCTNDEKIAKDIANKKRQREKLEEKSKLTSWKSTLNSDDKLLNIIIKSDVQGSVEAIKNILSKLEVNGVNINIIRSSVGDISESDVMLASTSSAIIYGFNIKLYSNVKGIAEQQGVQIRTHSIIYKLKDEIKAILTGMLEPVFEEEVIGKVEVRGVWVHSKVGIIVGGYVTEGKVKRNSSARLIRDNVEIYNGTIKSLKHIKEDIKEATAGKECGMIISNLKEAKEGDIVEVYQMIEVKNDVN